MKKLCVYFIDLIYNSFAYCKNKINNVPIGDARINCTIEGVDFSRHKIPGLYLNRNHSSIEALCF